MAAAAQGFGGAGFGMGMHTSATAFRQTYVAYSTSIHEAAEGRMDRISGGRQNVMFGGNGAWPRVSRPFADSEIDEHKFSAHASGCP